MTSKPNRTGAPRADRWPVPLRPEEWLGDEVLLHLVRHARPVIEPGKPASSWRLDPAAPDLQRLRTFLHTNTAAASWHSSDEPKAVATASALTDGEVEVVPMLKEAVRADWFAHRDHFEAAALAAFARPADAAHPGWEPFDQTRARVRATADEIVKRSRTDVVLVGHGTAWTLLVSDITGQPPDLESWRRLGQPDLCTLDLDARSVVRAWGTWQLDGSPTRDSVSSGDRLPVELAAPQAES